MTKHEPGIPRIIVGSFIFNNKGELLLIKSPAWNNKYTCVGGKVEFAETIERAVKRETKEETNLSISDINFLGVSEAPKLNKEYKKDNKHLVFLNYKCRADKVGKIKLNEEATEFKWLKPGEWIKENNVSRFTKDVIESKLINQESFEAKYMRALADYQNLLRQSSQDKEEFAKFANERILTEILPIYDNLRLVVEQNSNGEKQDAWFEGVKYLAKQMAEFLENAGVKKIETLGKKFNYNTMEAVESEDVDDKKKDDIVGRELKAGYTFYEKVILPARVAVYKFKNNN